VIADAVARGTFAGLSLLVWAVGAIGWTLAYRTRPPTKAVALVDTADPDDDRRTDDDRGGRK
jgi:hypothetical protein